MTDSSMIELQTTAAGEIRRFSASNEFLQWLREERDRWIWLGEVRQRLAAAKVLINAQLNPWSNEVNKFDGATSLDEEHKMRLASGAAAGLSEAVRKGNLLTSEDPAGRFVLQLATSAPRVATFALAQLLKIDLPETEAPRESFEGRFRAMAFLQGIAAEAAQATSAALAALSTEYRTEIEALRVGRAAVGEEILTLLTTTAKEHEILRGRFHGERNAETEQARLSAAERVTEFENLKKGFAEFMKLKAPVDYWNRKAMWHRIVAGVFFVATLASGFFLVREVLKYARTLLSPAIDAAKTSATQATAAGAPNAINQPPIPTDPPLWELGLVLLLVTLAIWLLRVLVRVVLSNLHQGEDAASRATMTEAYLALLSEGKGLAESDRILVLSTLFRPISTGLTKDDGMPPSITELLSRIVGGKGS